VDLQNRTAVVTGASSGIGLCTTEALLEKGAMVYGLSRSETPIEHEKFRWIPADLSRPRDIMEAFGSIREHEERIDVLVNNAGIGLFGDVETLSAEAWGAVIGVNLTAAFLCTREVVPLMKRQRSGTIVNVSSIAGKRGFRGGTAYCASKFGLNGFSEALMEELREYGIRVISLNPGSTDTAFFDRAGLASGKRMDPVQIARVIIQAVALPDDVLVDQIVVRPL